MNRHLLEIRHEISRRYLVVVQPRVAFGSKLLLTGLF